MRSPTEIFTAKMKMLLAGEQTMDKAAAAFQRELYELLLSEYLPLFDLSDGILRDNDKNDRLINQIDNYFDSLQKTLERDVLAGFTKTILESASLSAEYYASIGFKKTVIRDVLKNKVNLEKRLGITPTGRVRRGGYLHRLGQTAQVRNELKDYILNSLVNADTSFIDFQLGFRNLVIGNKRQKGLATTGSLQRYFDQFAYDAFTGLDAAANKQLATNLGLEHILYVGSLIKTSRRFCRKRAGRAFLIQDVVDTWKDDPDLIDKKTRAAYRPMIERGRFRCRHFIRPITATVYESYEKRGRTGLLKL